MEIPRSARRAASHALLFAALAAAGLAAASIAFLDQPVARLLARYEPDALWAQIMELLEGAIGWTVHPLLVSFVLAGAAVAAVIVPRLRAMAPAAMFVAGTHVFTRYAVGEIKDLTGRLRPTEWLARGGEAAGAPAAPGAPGSPGAFDLFGLLDATFFRGGASFPSGHVALFASIAIPIAALWWPRAGWALAVPIVVGAARVAVNAHYVSDALAAVALVCLIAWIVGLGARPVTAPPAPPAPR